MPEQSELVTTGHPHAIRGNSWAAALARSIGYRHRSDDDRIRRRLRTIAARSDDRNVPWQSPPDPIPTVAPMPVLAPTASAGGDPLAFARPDAVPDMAEGDPSVRDAIEHDDSLWAAGGYGVPAIRRTVRPAEPAPDVRRAERPSAAVYVDHLELAEATTIGGDWRAPSAGDREGARDVSSIWIVALRGAGGEPVWEEALTGAIVIGRAPLARPGYDDSLAAISGEDSLSRSHAVVTPMRRNVLLIDLESTNGTVVVRGDGSTMICRPHQPVKIGRADVVELGDVTLTVRRANKELTRC